MITGTSAGATKERHFRTPQPTSSTKASTMAKDSTVTPAAMVLFWVGVK